MASEHIDPIQYQSDADQMAMRIGHAMTAWADIEDYLMRLFTVLTDTNLNIASAIMSNLSFSSSLKTVRAVAAVFLSDRPEAIFWKGLSAYVEELSNDRNNIAHSAVRGSYVGPTVTKHIAGNGKRTLSMSEVDELILDMRECQWMIYGFEIHLTGYHPRDEVYQAPLQRRRPPRAKRLESRPDTSTQ